HVSPFAPDPAGTEFQTLDLVRALALPRALIAWPENASIELAEVLDGSVEDAAFFRFPLSEMPGRISFESAPAQRELLRIIDAFGITGVHLQHLMFCPIAVARPLREAGLPYVLRHHDYYVVCPDWLRLDSALDT